LFLVWIEILFLDEAAHNIHENQKMEEKFNGNFVVIYDLVYGM
jgi:hypothetical protein